MTTAVIHSIDAVRERLATARRSGTVGFVPTMGSLHAGHTRLIDEARRECAVVVVSIFVNPLQFDREDDLLRYPRPLDMDIEHCSDHGVDLVFVPEVSEMYPSPPSCTVDVGGLGDHMCGRHRPGHFRGVATVVLKLLNIIQPDRAYFGEKDAQQLAIVRRLVRDFDVPVAIVGVPTVRESDGLALSSRNRQLTVPERALSPVLYQALCEADRQISRGLQAPEEIRAAAAARVPHHPLLRLEYLEIVDPENMQPVRTVSAPVLVAGALWVGSTRLIDNVSSAPPSTKP